MDFGGHRTESQLEEFFFFVKSTVLVRKKRDVILLMRLNLIGFYSDTDVSDGHRCGCVTSWWG